MDARSAVILLLHAAIAVSFLALPCLAQFPSDYPAVGLTAPGTCDGAPDLWDAPASSEEIGIFDLWIYALTDPYASIRTVRLGATWPSDWRVLGLEVCHGTMLQGNFIYPGLGFTLEVLGEPLERPAIRLRFEVTHPGRFSLIPDPQTGEFAYQLEDGTWRDFFGFETGRFAYAEIGRRCGWWPPRHAGDVCAIFVGHSSAGHISGLTTRLALPLGATHVDTVIAWGPQSCPNGIPLCGGPLPGMPCFGGLLSSVGWIRLERIEILGPASYRYRVTTDTQSLAPGGYSGYVIAAGACPYCREVCYEIDLDVAALPVETATWGQIKTRYRE